MEENPQLSKSVDIKQANRTLYIGIGIIIILIAALLTNGFGIFKKTPITPNSVSLAIGNSPVIGDVNAPVTIYEFSTFSCPFCAAADNENPQYIASLKSQDPTWEAPIPNIMKDYVDTGKVRIVFKYFPGHPGGENAMKVGLALDKQKLFWKFGTLAFANQADVPDLDKMKSLAEQLGANMTELNNDLANNNYNAQLTEDTNMGTSNNVQGTPTFFINGKAMEGALSYSKFKQVIDSELK